MKRISVAGYLFVGWMIAFLGWWHFALAPLTNTSPQWIETARAVCFGSLPNGLPAGYGWITLILSPLFMVTVLAVIWADELLNDLRILKSSLVGKLMLVLFVVVPISSLSWGVGRVITVQKASLAIQAPPELSGDFPENYPVFEGPAPDFRLLNQAGETISLESLKGRKFLLTFAFAHCASTCPGLVYTVREAADSSLEDPPPAVVLVTLDPWRDTPGALPGLAKKWELADGDHVLSGEVEAVEAVAQAYNVSTSRNLQSGDIIHSGVIFLFNEKGELLYQLNSPSVKWIQQALSRI